MSSRKEYRIERRRFWEGVIGKWRLSGLSGRQFCRQEGIAVASFYNWRKKLADEKANKEPEVSDFLEVSISGTAASSAPVELTLNRGSVIRISNSAQSDLLTRVFAALREANLC